MKSLPLFSLLFLFPGCLFITGVFENQCGNNITDPGEVCDDGNTQGNDGCREDCLGLERCGDGLFDLPAGEECDDGNNVDGDGCDANCQLEANCQDGVLVPGEICFPEEALTLATGAGPRAILLADLDGDTRLDIATANAGDGTVSVFFGEEGGGFTEAVSIAVGGAPSSLVQGDLDGDGDLDLVPLIPNSDTLTALFNDGNRGFVNQEIFSNGDLRFFAVAIGDLDGDGDQDLILTHFDANGFGLSNDRLEVGALLNNGKGSFVLQQVFAIGHPILDNPPTPTFVTLGDVDADGDLDVVFAPSSTNTVDLLLLAGGGFGEQHRLDVEGQNPVAVALGDFDGTGKQALVSVNRDDNQVSTLFDNGNGDLTFRSLYVVGQEPVAAAVGDLDFNGEQDVIIVNRGDDNLSFLINLGNGLAFSELPDEQGGFLRFAVGEPGVPHQPTAVAVGDINGDGVIDIVTANEGSDSVGIFLSEP